MQKIGGLKITTPSDLEIVMTRDLRRAPRTGVGSDDETPTRQALDVHAPWMELGHVRDGCARRRQVSLGVGRT